MRKGKWKKPLMAAVSTAFVSSVFLPISPGSVSAAPPAWAGQPEWAGQPGGPTSDEMAEYKKAKWGAKLEKWKDKRKYVEHGSKEFENILLQTYEQVVDEWDEDDTEAFDHFFANNFDEDWSKVDSNIFIAFLETGHQYDLEIWLEAQLGREWNNEDWIEVINWIKDRFNIEEAVFTLSIFHTNNIQGNVNDLPNLVSAINEKRENDTLLLDSGNFLSHGMNDEELEDFAEVINLANYDALGLGEEEFEEDDLADFIDDVDAPFLSANVNMSENDALAELKEDDEIAKGIILEIDGKKIGVFGLTEESADTRTISVDDYVESTKSIVDYFTNQDIEIVVGLSNIELETNATIAESVDGIDVIIGSNHTDRLLSVTEDVDGKAKDATLIVNAEEDNEYLGKLDLTFDEDGVISEYSRGRFSIDDYEAHDDAKDIIE